ncbi:acyltransferase family protein [uncultured Draconibacterium sp.]|uniref:acyltransferase n=1 Tax=uncultured Draconibacterium sp. TaxID=1573823 RepID=UPI002AA90020|nr:acyltransferase family protein [uncultured Draconibacterium sp.]
MQIKKLEWADDLRIFAILAVIVIHAVIPIVHNFNSISLKYWWLGNILNSASRFCIPVFLMLTGALMLPKEYQLGDFFKKRMLRILLPFILWNFIYIVYKWNRDSIEINFLEYSLSQFQGGAYYHLWYVYMIIGIYLIFPVLNKWIKYASIVEMRYFLVIWIISLLLKVPSVKNYFPNINLGYFAEFIGYPVLGHYLNIISIRKVKQVSILLFIGGITITAIGAYVLSNVQKAINEDFYSYLSLNVMMSSIGIFLFIKNTNLFKPSRYKIFKLMGDHSYGIYLSHLLFLELMINVGITWDFLHPFIGIPLTILLCLILSSLTVILINKLPLGYLFSG